MNKKLTAFAVLIAVILMIYGCGSGQYNIEKGNYPDTTYKSTGAKLKGTYKVRTAPSFTLQFAGNINLGMAELSSNYENIFDSQQFVDGQNFGVKYGFGFMLTGKVPLHKPGNIRLNITTAFNRFQSDLFTKTSPFGQVRYNVLTLGFGVENSFNPSYRLKPYVAVELQGNLISGKADIVDVSAGTTRNVKIKNTFRIGYMVYSGLEYMINNKVGVNFGLKLTNSNQILKQSSVDSDPNEVSIRDKKVSDPLEFGGFKNFTYTSFFMGFNFYIGVYDVLFKF
jgi:hypothetical protein